MVIGVVFSSHQLQGDVGSISGITVNRDRHSGSSRQTQGRQYSNCVLHQSHGRYTLPTADEVDITDLDVVPREKASFVSQADKLNQIADQESRMLGDSS